MIVSRVHNRVYYVPLIVLIVWIDNKKYGLQIVPTYLLVQCYQQCNSTFYLKQTITKAKHWQ